MKFLHKAHWIWTDPQDQAPDIYRLFRKDFTFTPGSEKVMLEIAVCSTFALWINGQLLPGQQLSDFPQHPTGSCLDISSCLKPGKNTLLLQVHYIGEDFLTTLAGIPFVKAAIYTENQFLLGSDDSWQCCSDGRFTNSLACKVTPQLGFAFEYDPQKILPENTWMH